MKKINTNWAYWWLYISFVLTKSLEQASCNFIKTDSG